MAPEPASDSWPPLSMMVVPPATPVSVTVPAVLVLVVAGFSARPAVPLAVSAPVLPMTMSLAAVRVSVLALQLTASLTLMFPVPVVPPLLERTVTLPPARLLLSTAPVTSPPLAAMVKSCGSINQSPLRPCGAKVSTRVPSSMWTCSPEVSMLPPLPPRAPPRALKPPAMLLAWLLHTAMEPPSPDCVASACNDAPASTVVLAACGRPSPPRAPPPTRMLPPPCAPEASTLPPTSTSRSESSCTLPPCTPLASMAPLSTVLPPLPTRRTTPPSVLMPWASMTPLLLTRLVNRSLAAEACSTTVPPSACSLPLFATAASSASSRRCRAPVTCTPTRPSPSKSSTALSAPSRLMLPRLATIRPSFSTLPPTRLTEPPLAAWMVPWLTTPALPPWASRLKWRERKSSGVRSSVLATRPPTFSCALLPKMMPWVLIRNTWPLELMWPKIWLGFWSKMRLSAIALCEGWLNSTEASLPRLKLCQFSASSADCWLTTVLAPLCVIEPTPPTTTPPAGMVVAATPPAAAASAPPQNASEPSASDRLSASRCCRSRGRAVAGAACRRDVRWMVRVVVFMVVVR